MIYDVGIKLFKNEKVVFFILQEISDKIGIISDIFDLIKERGINLLLVDTIPLPKGKICFNFVVQDSEREEMKNLLEEIVETSGAGYLKEFDNVALLVFLGENFARKKGVVAEILNILAFYGIKIFLISSSLHSFSILISKEKMELALGILRENLNILEESIV
ncbi:MAG: ACT domain-containing protein [candidate division WOR-3 bacterium]